MEMIETNKAVKAPKEIPTFVQKIQSIVNRVANTIVSLLRPVSPFAWLPLGLYVLEAADPSAIWVIFICSIWLMILNTADGVRNAPRARLELSEDPQYNHLRSEVLKFLHQRHAHKQAA